MKLLNPPLHELVAAAHSPFDSQGKLAPSVVVTQARFLSHQGIQTVFITGSTGESHSVTQQEKLTLYEAWAEAATTTSLRVIAHVGSNCLTDAKELAEKASELGFVAISALAPSYYKPGNLSTLVDCCAEIAAAAPDLPFYYYDIPVLTGVNFPMADFLRLAPERIPNLAGIKFTNPDLVSYRSSLQVANGEFDLPWGVDESLLGALATGAQGGVGSTFNWAPELYRRIIQCLTDGDLPQAQHWQSVSIEMITAIASTGFLGTAKALMSRLGVPVGPARLPMGNPTDQQVDSLMSRLENLGFSDWGAKAETPSYSATA